MTQPNGNGKPNWASLYTAMRFVTPMLLAFLVYYVTSENNRSISEFREEIEAEYVSKESFNNFVQWRYIPDQKREAQTLEELKVLLKEHAERNDP